MRVVAEAGQTMMASVETAIDQAYRAMHAGAWGYKTQLLTPETIARPDASLYWDDKFGNKDQREAFTRAGLIDYGAWAEVKNACDDFGITFLATPFDLDAVAALDKIGVRHYKIASGDITYQQLIEEVAQTGAEIILSTGASTGPEIDRAVKWCGPLENVTLLACTLSYPTPAHAANLGRIAKLQERFPYLNVGYSDHTSLPDSGMCAAALGSTLNEVHYTLDRSGPDVPDHAMALDPTGLARYVEASNRGALLRGAPNLAPCDEELPARRGARRSICAKHDLPEGHIPTLDDFAYLRPGDGIPPYLADSVAGIPLTRAKKAGEPL